MKNYNKSKFTQSILLGLALTISSAASFASSESTIDNSEKVTYKCTQKSSVFKGALFAIAAFASPQVVSGFGDSRSYKRYNPNLEEVTVLTIDGGGTHGVVPLTVINELEKATGKPIHQSVDVMGGTSVGSILTSFFTAPKDPTQPIWDSYSSEEVLKLMYEDGPKLFGERNKFPYNFPNNPSLYNPRGLEAFCAKVLKDTSFADSIIPRAAYVFDKNAFAVKRITSEDTSEIFRSTDVVLSSSALPIALPSRKISPIGFMGNEPKYIFADGALLDNCPETDTIAFAREIYPNAKVIKLISLGDSIGAEYVDITTRKKTKIFNMIGHTFFNLDVNSYGGVENKDLTKVLGKQNYVRFNPIMEKDISLVDGSTKSLIYMQEETLKHIEKHRDRFEDMISILKK